MYKNLRANLSFPVEAHKSTKNQLIFNSTAISNADLHNYLNVSEDIQRNERRHMRRSLGSCVLISEHIFDSSELEGDGFLSALENQSSNVQLTELDAKQNLEKVMQYFNEDVELDTKAACSTPTQLTAPEKETADLDTLSTKTSDSATSSSKAVRKYTNLKQLIKKYDVTTLKKPKWSVKELKKRYEIPKEVANNSTTTKKIPPWKRFKINTTDLLSSQREDSCRLDMSAKPRRPSKVKQIAQMFNAKITQFMRRDSQHTKALPASPIPKQRTSVPIYRAGLAGSPRPSPRLRRKHSVRNTCIIAEDVFRQLSVKDKVLLYNKFIEDMANQYPEFSKHANHLEDKVRKAMASGEVVNECQQSVQKLRKNLEAKCGSTTYCGEPLRRAPLPPTATTSTANEQQLLAERAVVVETDDKNVDEMHVSRLTVVLKTARGKQPRPQPRTSLANKLSSKSDELPRLETFKKRNNLSIRSIAFDAFAPPKKIRCTRMERLIPRTVFDNRKMERVFYDWLQEMHGTSFDIAVADNLKEIIEISSKPAEEKKESTTKLMQEVVAELKASENAGPNDAEVAAIVSKEKEVVPSPPKSAIDIIRATMASRELLDQSQIEVELPLMGEECEEKGELPIDSVDAHINEEIQIISTTTQPQEIPQTTIEIQHDDSEVNSCETELEESKAVADSVKSTKRKRPAPEALVPVSTEKRAHSCIEETKELENIAFSNDSKAHNFCITTTDSEALKTTETNSEKPKQSTAPTTKQLESTLPVTNPVVKQSNKPAHEHLGASSLPIKTKKRHAPAPPIIDPLPKRVDSEEEDFRKKTTTVTDLDATKSTIYMWKHPTPTTPIIVFIEEDLVSETVDTNSQTINTTVTDLDELESFNTTNVDFEEFSTEKDSEMITTTSTLELEGAADQNIQSFDLALSINIPDVKLLNEPVYENPRPPRTPTKTRKRHAPAPPIIEDLQTTKNLSNLHELKIPTTEAHSEEKNTTTAPTTTSGMTELKQTRNQPMLNIKPASQIKPIPNQHDEPIYENLKPPAKTKKRQAPAPPILIKEHTNSEYADIEGRKTKAIIPNMDELETTTTELHKNMNLKSLKKILTRTESGEQHNEPIYDNLKPPRLPAKAKKRQAPALPIIALVEERADTGDTCHSTTATDLEQLETSKTTDSRTDAELFTTAETNSLQLKQPTDQAKKHFASTSTIYTSTPVIKAHDEPIYENLKPPRSPTKTKKRRAPSPPITALIEKNNNSISEVTIGPTTITTVTSLDKRETPIDINSEELKLTTNSLELDSVGTELLTSPINVPFEDQLNEPIYENLKRPASPIAEHADSEAEETKGHINLPNSSDLDETESTTDTDTTREMDSDVFTTSSTEFDSEGPGPYTAQAVRDNEPVYEKIQLLTTAIETEFGAPAISVKRRTAPPPPMKPSNNSTEIAEQQHTMKHVIALPKKPIYKRKVQRKLSWQDHVMITEKLKKSAREIQMAKKKAASKLDVEHNLAKYVKELFIKYNNTPTTTSTPYKSLKLSDINSSLLRSANSPNKIKSLYKLTVMSTPSPPTDSDASLTRTPYRWVESLSSFTKAPAPLHDSRATSELSNYSLPATLPGTRSTSEQSYHDDKTQCSLSVISADQGFETGTNNTLASPARSEHHPYATRTKYVSKSPLFAQLSQELDRKFAERSMFMQGGSCRGRNSPATPTKSSLRNSLALGSAARNSSPLLTPGKPRSRSLYDKDTYRSPVMQVIEEDHPLQHIEPDDDRYIQDIGRTPSEAIFMRKATELSMNSGVVNLGEDVLSGKTPTRYWVTAGDFTVAIELHYNPPDRTQMLYDIFCDELATATEIHFGIDDNLFCVPGMLRKINVLNRFPRTDGSNYWFSANDAIIPFSGKHMPFEKIMQFFEFIYVALEEKNVLRFGIDHLEFSNVLEKQRCRTASSCSNSQRTSLSGATWTRDSSRRSTISPQSALLFRGLVRRSVSSSPEEEEAINSDAQTLETIFQDAAKTEHDPSEICATLTVEDLLANLVRQQTELGLIEERVSFCALQLQAVKDASVVFNNTPQCLRKLKGLIRTIDNIGRRNLYKTIDMHELQVFVYFVSRYAGSCITQFIEHANQLMQQTLQTINGDQTD